MDLDIDALLRLAEEPSSEKRRELLHAVTDMFLEAPSEHSSEAAGLFGDVMTKVADDVDVDSRSTLAERVAPVDHTPHQLVRKLAEDDEISVARPVLRQSNVLTDKDLVELAEVKSQSHMQAMTEREQLATVVTDVLIRRGNQEVLRGVSGNTGAKFSDNGAKKLVERAADDNVIQRNLFARTDLPEDCSSEVKDMVRSRNVVAPPKVLDEVQLFVEKVITDFANLAGVPEAQVTNMIHGNKIEPVIIIGRALELSPDEFENVLRLRLRKPGRVGSELINGMKRFNELPVATAQRVIRFLKVRTTTESAA